MTKKRCLAFLTSKSSLPEQALGHTNRVIPWVLHSFLFRVTQPSGLSKAVVSLQVALDTGITKDLLFANNRLVNLFHLSPFIFLLLDTMPFYASYSPYSL